MSGEESTEAALSQQGAQGGVSNAAMAARAAASRMVASASGPNAEQLAQAQTKFKGWLGGVSGKAAAKKIMD